MKVEIGVRELSDVRVDRVSMVKNAANRIPYRFFKSAEGKSVLDLSKLFRTKKGTAPNGAEMDQQQALEAAKQILEDAGFTIMVSSTDTSQATPDAKTANGADKANAAIDNDQQPNGDQKNPNGGDDQNGDQNGNQDQNKQPTANGNDDGKPAAAMGGDAPVPPAKNNDAANGEQNDKVNANGDKSAPPPAANQNGGPAAGNGGGKSFPPNNKKPNKGKNNMPNEKLQALKADMDKIVAAMADLMKAEPQKQEPPAMEDKVNNSPGKEDQKATGATDTSGVGVDDPEQIANDPKVQDGKSAGTSGQGGKDTYNMLKKMQDEIAASMAALTKSVEKSMKEFGGRIDKVEASVKKAEQDIKGTVQGDAQGDNDGRVTTRKSAGAPPLLDTGMSRSR
jgi:hypothetical protein